MALRKLRAGFEVVFTPLVLLGFALHFLFSLYLPLRWRQWRATSRFKGYLMDEGLPKEVAERLAASQFKSLKLLSFREWWRAFGRRGRRGHRA